MSVNVVSRTSLFGKVACTVTVEGPAGVAALVLIVRVDEHCGFGTNAGSVHVVVVNVEVAPAGSPELTLRVVVMDWFRIFGLLSVTVVDPDCPGTTATTLGVTVN